MRYFLLVLFWICLIPAFAHDVANVFVENGKMGLKDDEDNVLIPAHYEKLGWSHSAPVVVGNTIGYQSRGNWGLISIQNKIITPAIYHSLEPGTGQVILGTRQNFAFRYLPMGVLNTEGEILIPFTHPSIVEAENRTFIIKKISDQRSKYGIVNNKNQLVIDFQYDGLRYLGSNRFAAKKGYRWGVIDLKNEVISDFKFDEISSYTMGYARVVMRRSVGLIDLNGKVVIPPAYARLDIQGSNAVITPFPQWDVLTPGNRKIHSVNFDSIIPWEENRWKVIANKHEWLVDENFEAITSNSFSRISRINNNLALYSDNGKVGVIYHDGRTLIEAAYDSLFANKDRIFARARSGVHVGWSMFNLQGDRIAPFSYQDIKREISGGLIPVKRNNYWGFMNREGKEVISCTYEYVGMAQGNYIAVGFKGGEGIISNQGQWIITPAAGQIRLMNSNYYLLNRDGVNYLKHYQKGTVYFTSNELKAGDGFLVETREDGSFWKINLSGRIIEAHDNLDYQEIREKSEGFIAVKIHGKFGFIDEQDRLRIAYRYDDVQNFSEGLAAFKLMGRWGYINKQENIAIQPMYSSVSPFHNGLAIASKNGMKGVIDKTTKVRIPFEYEDITPLETGRYLIRKNQKFGLLDERGMIIVNPQFDYLEDLPGGEVIVKKHNKFGVVSRRGDALIPPVYDYMIYDAFNHCYLGMKKTESTTLPIR